MAKVNEPEVGWEIVPYEDEAPVSRFRVRDQGRVDEIMRHLQAHECVALIGPPFSDKSRLLQDVASALLVTGRYRPLYIDLWQTSSHDEAEFFASLSELIEGALGTAPDESERRPQNARAFQNYLHACLDAQPLHVVLLIDHLQALPHDLVHSLLLALRAAYMERAIDEPRQLTAIVTGGMNLVGLSAGVTSPFNIAKTVLALPLSAAQSLALAKATLRGYDVCASSGALARILEWSAGDQHLISALSQRLAQTAQGYRRSLVDRRLVDRVAPALFLSEEGQAPIREAIRMIEEDPDTLLDVLHLLRHETLARSHARQLPTRTGVDRLQLSGAVVLADGCYALKNLAYRHALGHHFTTDRVGHILRIAGLWQEAIAYLAPQLAASQDLEARSQLLEATVQSIYASDSLARSWELLAHGLEQGFALSDVAVYRAIPARGSLALVYPQPSQPGETYPQVIHLQNAESVEARTFEYGRYALRGRADEARLVVALTTPSRRMGIVTVERYIQGRDPHELPSQLPELLHFLGHAASAIENVMIRAAYREIGQAVLDASTLQPALERVLEVVSEALGCDAANLYLLDPIQKMLEMVAGVGQLWNTEWQALARFRQNDEHPAATALREGRMRLMPGTDPRLNRAIIDRFGLQKYTWLFLPLQAAGQPLGTLELGYSETFRIAPSEENRTNLTAFANQVAIAVHNMQLLRRTDEALARRVDELEKLRSSSLAISAVLDVPTVLARIIRDLKSLFPGTETTIWEYDPEHGQLSVLQSTLDDPAYLAQQLDLQSVTGRAAISRQVRSEPRLDVLPSAASDPAVALGLRGVIAAPLVSHDRVLGAIDLYAYAGRPQAIQDGAADLLEAFAAHAAVAIDNARLHEEEIKRQRLEQELAVAREIQNSLLPRAWPVVSGWQFAAAYRAARVVGGDFYDFCELAGDPPRLGVVIADVTDKGIPAALFMALSRTLIRTMAMTGRGPGAVLARSNTLIINDSRGDIYLTAVYAVIDLSTGHLLYANAGHNRPLRYRAADATIAELAAPGILLGAFDNIELQEQQVDLSAGDVVVFYTDGITEAQNAEDEQFGEESLVRVIAENAGQDAGEVLQAVLDAVSAFSGSTEQTDDITCVVVKKLA